MASIILFSIKRRESFRLRNGSLIHDAPNYPQQGNRQYGQTQRQMKLQYRPIELSIWFGKETTKVHRSVGPQNQQRRSPMKSSCYETIRLVVVKPTHGETLHRRSCRFKRALSAWQFPDPHRCTLCTAHNDPWSRKVLWTPLISAARHSYQVDGPGLWLRR